MGQVPSIGTESFHNQIREVEKQVDKVAELLKRLKEANEESKSVTKASAVKAIRKCMQNNVHEVGKIARTVKAKLEAINKDNLANRQRPGCEKGTGVDRATMNLTKCIGLPG